MIARIRLVLIIVSIVLAALCGLLLCRLTEPPVPPIPDAPITAAPKVDTWTPTPTQTRVPSTFTPTSTATASPTPTATSTLTPLPPTPTATPTLPAIPAGRGQLPDTGENPLDNADVILTLLDVLLVAIMGGAVSRALDNFEWWSDWKPADPNLKMLATLVITSLVGGALVWVQAYVVPEYWQFVPLGMRIFIVAVATFALSQYWHANDKKAQARLFERILTRS